MSTSQNAGLRGVIPPEAVVPLRLVCATLPHLSGLAQEVRLEADARVRTAGIFRSGRLLFDPVWLSGLEPPDAAFVLAHELLHLALRTHERAAGADPRRFNCAHDYIINDMLAEAFGRYPPAGGLSWPGAREKSAEALMRELADWPPDHESWSPRLDGAEADSPVRAALRTAGLLDGAEPRHAGSDVLPADLERTWFPAMDADAEDRHRGRVARAATRSLELGALQARLARALGNGGLGQDPELVTVEALRGRYRPPWTQALQSWIEAVAPGPRTFLRTSRRGGWANDVVRAGRRREGWMLHVVLDASGSMEDALAEVLGAIAAFCDAANVAAVRLVQCDVQVTRDELLTPAALRRVEVEGLGGSDLTPALTRLAADPQVEAAIVITDGEIDYPASPPPYRVLWVLTVQESGFSPPYGRVLPLRQVTGGAGT